MPYYATATTTTTRMFSQQTANSLGLRQKRKHPKPQLTALGNRATQHRANTTIALRMRQRTLEIRLSSSDSCTGSSSSGSSKGSRSGSCSSVSSSGSSSSSGSRSGSGSGGKMLLKWTTQEESSR